MNQLLDLIEDEDMRRELEEDIVEKLSETDSTILTNTYSEEELQKYILQLFTYQDRELYVGEVVIPDEDTYTEYQRDVFHIELEDTVRIIEEALSDELPETQVT
jgi:hypothetical protein